MNLITQGASQKFGLKPKWTKTSFIGIGGKNLGSSIGEVTVTIKLNDGTYLTNTFFVVKEITSYSPDPNYGGRNWIRLKGQLADDQYRLPGRIEALLGAGIWIQIIEPKIEREPGNQGIAHKTKIGYVIFENRDDPYKFESPYIGAISQGPSIKKLNDMIQRLWEIEELPQQKVRTKEENECEEIFINGHSRNKSGRYIVRMPFNDKIKDLGKSKRMALINSSLWRAG